MLEGILRGKKVVVLGFGRSGQAATRLLLVAGAKVYVSDRRKKEKLPQGLVSSFETQGVIFDLGRHRPEVFEGVDLVVTSPGVPPSVYAPALELGIPVIGELELAARFLKRPKVLAITGTNGKTTTTAMVADILRLDGRRVFVGGNYGTPFSEFILAGQKADYVVLEVSSFQLETIQTFAPHVGLLLNVTPDHLERYADFEEYALAKLRLFLYQKPDQFALLPNDLPSSLWSALETKAKIFAFGSQGAAVLKEGQFVLRIPGLDEERYPFTGFKPLGFHNRFNFMAASLAARLAGARPEAIKKAVKSFVGFPHRLEFIGYFGGVYFVNDSKATNVDATLKALEGLAGPLVLILGGKHKGASYKPLAPLVKEKVRLLILMGEARFIMAEELSGLVDTKVVDNLEEAVAVAISEAMAGDTVLLSPAAASFDQFENYQERGDIFRELVVSYAPQFLGEDNRTELVTYH